MYSFKIILDKGLQVRKVSCIADYYDTLQVQKIKQLFYLFRYRKATKIPCFYAVECIDSIDETTETSIRRTALDTINNCQGVKIYDQATTCNGYVVGFGLDTPINHLAYSQEEWLSCEDTSVK